MTQATTLNETLEFGIFDWIEWDKSPANEIFEQRLKMLEYADANDFFCYHLAEHHITPLSISPSPAVFLSAAFQRTSRLRLGPLVYLLPFYNPIRLLHEISMLDNLSNGRLELGVGRGIVPMEAETFGLDPADLWDRFNEEMSILLTGFTSDVLNHRGKHYNYSDIELWLHPQQKPYPPLWYASNNIETVPWMAQHSFNTCHVFSDNAATKEHYDLYKRVWNAERMPDGLNSHVAAPKLGLVRHVYVAPTDEQAVEEAKPAFGAWFHNINYLWEKNGYDFLNFIRDFDDLESRDIVIAGSPSTVRERVQQAIDETGVNYFCPIFAWGDLTPEQVMRCMELFVDDVMPNLRPGNRG
jgi:alkanesulfonate monooxygenase SsuD/methylene tetrahydromethanopterin reductase-like flavin-dependent oxidoreductase (luciferase family)